MKLAVSSYSMWRWMRENNRSLENAIDTVASFGVEGIEFAELDRPARTDIHPLKRAEQIRKHCDRAKLVVPSYCVSAELLTDAETQAQTIERLKTDVDVAVVLGAKSLRHDVTRGFGDNAKSLSLKPTFANALKVVVPAIREVASYGQSKKIRTSLENHGFFMQHSTRVEKLITAVKHRNFALTLDMGNFLCVNENPVNAVKRLAKYAVMAHVKDFHIRPKSRTPPTGWFATPTKIALRGAIVGHGEIDIPAELALLKSAKYKGWLSLEFEGIEDPTLAINEGLAYLRSLLA